MVRSVKIDGKWTLLSLKKGQKLRIPNDQGRWSITWREGRRIRFEPAKDYGHAYKLKLQKEGELHAAAVGIQITPVKPNRMRLDAAFDDFIEDQRLLDRAGKTVDAYRAVKRTFLKSCRVQFLDEVTRRDLLQYTFYLRTGFRKQEVEYLKWSDINFETQTARVKAKPEFGFIPKRWEERSVPVEEGLLRRLEERRKHRKANDLVFPTRNGKPNGKHLVALKRLAKKAKLDEEQFILHKFRATAATNWLRASMDVRTVQKLLGHRSLNSTLRYLQPLQVADIGKSAAWKAAHAGV